jgi:hypothetical protein
MRLRTAAHSGDGGGLVVVLGNKEGRSKRVRFWRCTCVLSHVQEEGMEFLLLCASKPEAHISPKHGVQVYLGHGSYSKLLPCG